MEEKQTVDTDRWNIPSLREYVLTKKDKDLQELEEASLEWTKVASKNRLTYEIDWFGVPVIQTPEDLVLMQELVFKIQPDVIVETGIAHGGSLIFYASLFEVLGKGLVIGVDIEIREHNKKVIEAHPLFKRIEMIEGDSVSDEVIQEVKNKIPQGSKVIVCLDSNHFKDHVYKELLQYQHLVNPGSYLVVFDTNSSTLAKLGACDPDYIENGPMEAIDDFLKTNDDFQVDEHYNKLFVTYSPNGYLKRIK